MYKWEYLNPEYFNPQLFCFHKLWAVKVRKHDGKCDVRGVRVRGNWKLFADVLEYHPITGKKLKYPYWFIFAAKGE
jgi:hypothetical protein